ncbi:MAG: sensor histidine kinase [Hyphomicrobiales bacterium]|nr:sensor histidine kinase [Hyphomicrobiales bacterium]
MMGRSLFLRLSLLAATLILIALVLGGAGVAWLFERELTRRAADDLSQHLRGIAGQVRLDADGLSLTSMPTDPRFAEPYSGLYWQVDAPGHRLRSRSLWDFTLPPPSPGEADLPEQLDGPNGSSLLALRRRVVLPAPTGETEVTITAAIDRRDLATARNELLRLLIPSLGLLGLLLIAAMATFLHVALRPFRILSAGMRALHSGGSRVLHGRFPDEVQPVVDDLNRLIAFQDAAVERAQAQAGDLAHGLKTPLALLDAAARQAAARGENELSKQVEEQVRAMDRHVVRALARARAGVVAKLGYMPAPIKPVVTKAVNAVSRLTSTRGLRWEIQINADPQFYGDPGDLTEMLGNLLDNAGKWAKSCVMITALMQDHALHVTVEDDGPGIPEIDIGRVERGRRWDESSPGSGFGLASTRDLAEAYRGKLVLQRSPLGGLAASLILPR